MKHRLGIILAAGLAAGAVVVLLVIDRAPVPLVPAPEVARLPAASGSSTPSPTSSPSVPPPAAHDSSSGATPAAVAPRAIRPSTVATAPSPAAPGLPPATANAAGEAAMPVERTITPEEAEQVKIELDQVGLMLRDYRTRIGENPWGTNAEIMKAVMGGNSAQARLGPPEGQQLNGDGELVDRWGTPYFFHQLSATRMEIHSAGPDKKRGTGDDIVHR